MENYKVRVENIAEADHVQQLFENIGYKKGELVNAGFPKLVVAVCDRDGKYSSGAQFYYSWHKCQELTIDQLDNLVASKTKKVPYLVKTIDKWEEQQLTSDTPESATCVRIPDGAIELLYSESNTSKYHFVKLNGDLMSVTDILDGEEYWYKDKLKYKNWGSVNVVWQRPTKPEELPFIDDEPKMSDIEQTLNERQSQYGSFEDVATVTQDLLAILERTGLKSLPKPHKEALHMICSKMARIVNGDFDYIENWHDIAGYATLMERDLKTKDGATNSKVVRTRVINGIMQEI